MQSLFADYFLPVTLAIITMGMGLSLTEKDFRNIFLQPKAVIIGLCCQMILLPVIAWLIARSANIDPAYKVGLMIIAACPGGATSNLITYLLRGNVALSISMTALNSILTMITIPLVVHFSLEAFHEDAAFQLPVGMTILKVFLITVLPTFVGTRIRKNYADFSIKLERPLRVVLPLLILLIYAGVIIIDQRTGPDNRSDFIKIFQYTLMLNILAMISGFLIARVLRLRVINQFTISIEVGLQNSALAIVVAATLLESNEMALVPMVYGTFSFFSTLLFGWSVKKLGWVPKFSEKGT
jgi:BASS family bile acid:Na+ symporter